MGDCEIGEVMRACGWKASESELKVGEDEILIFSHSEYLRIWSASLIRTGMEMYLSTSLSGFLRSKMAS